MLRGQGSLKQLLGRPLISAPRKRPKKDEAADDEAQPQAQVSRSCSAPDRLTAGDPPSGSLPGQQQGAGRPAQQSNKRQKRPGPRPEPPTRTISAPAFHATLGKHAAGGTCPICSADLPANLLAINLHIGAPAAVADHGKRQQLSAAVKLMPLNHPFLRAQMTVCFEHRRARRCQRQRTAHQSRLSIKASLTGAIAMCQRHCLRPPTVVRLEQPVQRGRVDNETRPAVSAARRLPAMTPHLRHHLRLHRHGALPQHGRRGSRALSPAHRRGSCTAFTPTWWGASISSRQRSAQTVMSSASRMRRTIPATGECSVMSTASQLLQPVPCV